MRLPPTMSTSGIYFATINQANQDHSDFEAKSQQVEKDLDFREQMVILRVMQSIGDSSGVSGVALSPPHPVTGVE